MAILDPNNLIYTKIQTALETEYATDDAISPENMVFWSGITGTQSPGKSVTGGEDYPQLTLRGSTSGTGDLHSGDETFATYSDEPTEQPQHWLETSTWNYEIEIVSAGLSELEYTILTARAVNAIRKSGPKLGLAWVSRIRYTFTCNDPDNPTGPDTDEDGLRRVVSKITIAVQTQIDGPLLTTEA